MVSCNQKNVALALIHFCLSKSWSSLPLAFADFFASTTRMSMMEKATKVWRFGNGLDVPNRLIFLISRMVVLWKCHISILNGHKLNHNVIQWPLQKLCNFLLRIKPQFQDTFCTLSTKYCIFFQRAFVKYALQKRKNVKLRLEVCHKVPEIETIYLLPCWIVHLNWNLLKLAILLTDTAALQNR